MKQRRKNQIYEESDNESCDGIVPPTVNYPVNLRLHNRRASVFRVADNMIRTPVSCKLKNGQFLTDAGKSSLLASFFDECVKHTLLVSHYVVFLIFIIYFKTAS